MTPRELSAIGQCLYGERWQSPLARDLGVTDRTVRDWAAGRGRPEAKRDEMLRLLAERRDVIDQLLSTIADGTTATLAAPTGGMPYSVPAIRTSSGGR